MKRSTLAGLAVSAFMLSGISTINASSFNNTTGLSGAGVTPSSTVTFDGALYAINTVITNQFASQGITMSPNLYYDGNNAYAGQCLFNDESGDCLTTYKGFSGQGVQGIVQPFSIFFNSFQTAAAFALVTSNGNGNANTLIQAFRNGTLVDQATFITGSSSGQNSTVPNYYGFLESPGNTFNEIRVTIGLDSNSGALGIIDNVQLSVPEPGTIGLLALGVSGIVVAARRRRRSA